MNNKKIIIGVGVVVATMLIGLVLIGGSKKLGAVFNSEQIFGGGILTSYIKYPVAKTLTAATNTLTVNDLSKGDFFKVDTTSNAVVINFPTIPSDFVGRQVTFAITAGTNLINMNAMNSDVTAVVTMAVNGTDAVANAVGDFARCIFISTSKATCLISAK